MSDHANHANRYSRQQRFDPIGEAGQQRLNSATVAIIGCGALGTAVAEQLARAGIGELVLIDRDFVEMSNLHRQGLFTEADAEAAVPKAIAAAQHLQLINSAVNYQPIVQHVTAQTIKSLISEVNLVVDGTDNFATRHVLNDACCQLGLPWVYGACVAAYGLSWPIIPSKTPCLRCVQSEIPLAGDGPTCDSSGVIGPVVQQVAAWQVAEVLKLIVGDFSAVRTELWATDLWANTFQRLQFSGFRDPDCRSCGPKADWPELSTPDQAAVVLCGRDAVQLPPGRPVDLERLAAQLDDRAIQSNAYLVRWHDGPLQLTVFADGRTVVQGADSIAAAHAVVDRWLG